LSAFLNLALTSKVRVRNANGRSVDHLSKVK
jgi:hypothetical protein